jgi:ABC-type transporter Mla subunit MlaD
MREMFDRRPPSPADVDDRQAFRAGLILVVSLILVATGCLVGPRLFRKTKRYGIFFQTARGLQMNGEVAIAGVVVGKIVAIDAPVAMSERPLGPDGQPLPLEARAVVELKDSARIYRECKVALVRPAVLGDTLIDFTAGNERSGLAENGWRFVGQSDPSMPVTPQEYVAKFLVFLQRVADPEPAAGTNLPR